MMPVAIIAIVLGFIALTWSADRFIAGAAATAKNWDISPMLIGLTVVAIGTSAPEILLSMMAALQGHTDIAVGNALGSNIVNIGLVLGLTALIAPLPIPHALAKKELPWLGIVTLLTGLFFVNGDLGWIEGLLLIALLVLTLVFLVRWQKTHPETPLIQGVDMAKLPMQTAYLSLLGGLVMLLASSQLLIWGATQIARQLGVSELVIGLTVVAIGTSLPELAASLLSALRQHYDIALGNVVGSNLFNLLGALAMPGLFAPGPLNSAVMWRDYPVMLSFTVLLVAIALIGKHKPRIIGRGAGLLLLVCYLAYGSCLYMQSS